MIDGKLEREEGFGRIYERRCKTQTKKEVVWYESPENFFQVTVPTFPLIHHQVTGICNHSETSC